MDLLVLWCQILLGVGVVLVLLGFVGVDLGDYIGVETFTLSCVFTFLGGIGWIMSYFTSSIPTIVIITGSVTAILSTIIHFFVVVPLKSTESSSLMSQQDMVRKRAEVLSTIPATGYGEILMTSSLSSSNQVAKSANGEEIPSGTLVVVTSIDEHGVFYVVPVNTFKKDYTLFG